MKRLLKSSDGFVLIAAMAAVVIIGIMAGAASQNWRTIMLREREEELLFRGMQYRTAIANWYRPRPGQPPTQQTRPLRELKDLLQDPNSLEKVKYLRRLYTDPITGKEFEPIIDPVRGIIGVKSTSQAPPLKQGNFPVELNKKLDGKNSYSEWEFTFQQQPTPPVQ